MCLALSKNFSTLCAIRFFIGLSEASFYPGMQVSSNLEMSFLNAAIVMFKRPT